MKIVKKQDQDLEFVGKTSIEIIDLDTEKRNLVCQFGERAENILFSEGSIMVDYYNAVGLLHAMIKSFNEKNIDKSGAGKTTSI